MPTPGARGTDKASVCVFAGPSMNPVKDPTLKISNPGEVLADASLYSVLALTEPAYIQRRYYATLLAYGSDNPAVYGSDGRISKRPNHWSGGRHLDHRQRNSGGF